MARSESTAPPATIDMGKELERIQMVIERCSALAVGVSEICRVEDIGADALHVAAFSSDQINTELQNLTKDVMFLKREGVAA